MGCNSMSYCINPNCATRQNPDSCDRCQSCGTPLVINERYRLVRRLDPARDSETEVWLVESGDRYKVLKVLTSSKPTLVKLFEREARILRQLDHIAIPKLETSFVFSTLTCSKDLHCLVLSYFEGDTLTQWVAKHGPVPPDLVLVWLKELTDILAYIHQHQVFHRDIKPDNILRCTDGHLALIDFGTVREVTATYVDKLDQGFPTTGIYSPGGYTPPEQLLGRAVSQSDFFALGRTCIYLLTGINPQEMEVCPAGELVGWRARAPQLIVEFADLIDDLIAIAPEYRPDNTDEICRRLETLSLTKTAIATPSAKTYFHQFISTHKLFTIGTVLSGCLVTYLLATPKLAEIVNNCGIHEYDAGNLSNAQTAFRVATLLSPNYAQPHYNLSLLCIDHFAQSHCSQDSIRKGLEIAAWQGLPEANAELAEQQIRANDLTNALKTIEAGFRQAQSPITKAALFTKRGWIRWQQQRLNEAEADLRASIRLSPDSPHAHCLLAQVLETKGKPQAALQYWRGVLEQAEYSVPEQDHCIEQARQRLH